MSAAYIIQKVDKTKFTLLMASTVHCNFERLHFIPCVLPFVVKPSGATAEQGT